MVKSLKRKREMMGKESLEERVDVFKWSHKISKSPERRGIKKEIEKMLQEMRKIKREKRIKKRENKKRAEKGDVDGDGKDKERIKG